MTTYSAPAATVSVAIYPEATRRLTESRIRADIQGLRAFAVLSVLTYHLNPEWLPGGFAGVDVFFVISGFLITQQLVREVERTGTLSLTRFWCRRILRLIPAATVVLVATAVAVMVTTPRTGWVRYGVDFAAAGGYSLNWVLASRSVNYLAQDAVASPVQHYWSLGVEEQFYLLWPVLILAMVLLARSLGGRLRPLLLGCIVVIAALSFGSALSRVAVSDPSAFFVTTSRLWELAVGAVAALVVRRGQAALGAAARGAVITIGLGLMVAALVLADDTAWPGWPALLPTSGAALVLLGGGCGRPRGIERLLATPPLVWVGGLSYAVYLWHWPIISLAHRQWPEFALAQYSGIAVASLALAWGTQRFIENRIRFAPWFRARPRRAFTLGATCLAGTLVISTALVMLGPRLALVPLNARPGGAVVLPAQINLTEHPVWSQGVKWALPAAVDSVADVPRAYADGCQQSALVASPLTCTYGDTTSGTSVALVGDSKALQWLPALATWASERRLKIVTYTKSSCPLADVLVALPNGRPYPSCREWYVRVMAELARTRPALVVTSQYQGDSAAIGKNAPGSATMVAGLERTWSVLTEQRISVAVLGDTPRTPNSITDCVIEFDRQLDRCEYSRASAVAASGLPSQLAAVNGLGGSVVDASGNKRTGRNTSLVMIDLTNAICPDQSSCPPVIGNVLVYRSASHITKTYVDSMTDRLARLLAISGLI